MRASGGLGTAIIALMGLGARLYLDLFDMVPIDEVNKRLGEKDFYASHPWVTAIPWHSVTAKAPMADPFAVVLTRAATSPPV